MLTDRIQIISHALV